MKEPRKLVNEIMTQIENDIGEYNNSLCIILDTLTDENCKALPNVNKNLVDDLQALALKLYKMTELVEDEKMAIEDQFIGYDEIIKGVDK